MKKSLLYLVAGILAALLPSFVHAGEITLTTSKAVGDSIVLKFYSAEFSGITVEGATEKERLEDDQILYIKYILESQTVKVSGDFTYIDCGNNSLTALDVSKCTGLKSLYCGSNSLTALDVSGCPKLTELYCYNNSLTALDVSKFPELRYLVCGNNPLTTLEVSNCPKLENFKCDGSSLTALEVSNCPKLLLLYCRYSSLTTLEVNNCPKLKKIFCEYNSLTTLEFTDCPGLYDIYCQMNQIKGKAMDDLIASLNDRSGDVIKGALLAIDLSDPGEGNVCTWPQVEAALRRGSIVYARKDQEWKKYPGSDPAGIDRTETGTGDVPAVIYDLEGRRSRELRPGINIVKTTGGKTVKVTR